MARSFLCIKCNVEFPSDALYVTHKQSGHKIMDKAILLEEPPVPTPPPGVPAEAMPSQEFMEQVARIESKDDAPDQSTASQHPSELPSAAPILLTYKYIGECPEHRTAVDTLELDVADQHFCIAICPTCKKQLDTRKAVKL